MKEWKKWQQTLVIVLAVVTGADLVALLLAAIIKIWSTWFAVGLTYAIGLGAWAVIEYWERENR